VSGLEQLWAGWRHEYVVAATDADRSGADDGCVFCRLAESGPPSPANGVVHRGERCYTVLNAYPYASGHLLVVPLRHVEEMDALDPGESGALWDMTREAIRVLSSAYAPEGMNLGANLGRAAGAGIPRHLHLHVVPRWAGDTNFMTAVAGVRVLPESLEAAWEKIHDAWDGERG
jgi:ATP adenylyltransferase